MEIIKTMKRICLVYYSLFLYKQYYDAFSINQITYDPIKHTYISIPPQPINCKPSTKVDVFKNRYQLIRQHLLHNELFQKPILETGNNNSLNHLELQPIDTLILSSSISASTTCYILGLLNCDSEENIVTLEDPNGKIILDISKCISFFLQLFLQIMFFFNFVFLQLWYWSIY